MRIETEGKRDQEHFPVSTHPQFGVKDLEDERKVRNFKVAVVSSFASDEPIEEIIEAAKILAETTTFYVTGDSSRLAEECSQNGEKQQAM